MSAAISEFLSKSKVNNIYHITLLSQTHKEIVRFDISMDEITAVNEVYSTYLLKREFTILRSDLV